MIEVKTKQREGYSRCCLAGREGFEPSEGVTPRRFSKPLLSSTQPPSRIYGGGAGGIRTHEGFDTLTIFKTVAFNRSATAPDEISFSCYEA